MGKYNKVTSSVMMPGSDLGIFGIKGRFIVSWREEALRIIASGFEKAIMVLGNWTRV